MTGGSLGKGRCRFCGERLPEGPVRSGERTYCSRGCRRVDETLETDGSHERTIPETSADSPTTETGGEPAPAGDFARTYLRVDGMHRASCEVYLESVATGLDGVVAAEASYVTETVRVDYDPDAVEEGAIRDALTGLGYTAYLREATPDSRDETAGEPRRRRETEGTHERKRRKDDLLGERYAAGVVFGTFALLPYIAVVYPTHVAELFDVGLFATFEGPLQFDTAGTALFLQLYLGLSAVVLLFTGWPVLRGAYVSLKTCRPTTDLLVASAALAAYVYGTIAVLVGRTDVFYDLAVVVPAVVTGAVFYEAATKRRAMDRLTDLTSLQVHTATLLEADDSTREVDVADLTSGDRVLVARGERVPVDGVVEAACTVDESVVTGESLPIEKRPGDRVRGGSVVTADAAVVRVGDGTTSEIDRLTASVWGIQSSDHGVQRRADALAAWILPGVLGAALLVGVAATVAGASLADAGLLAVLALIVATPWTLGLSTPLSVATALRAALARGIVVFDETVFERLREIDVVVFDKTGTLTTGELTVRETTAPADALAAGARLERRTSHPVAAAIVDAFGPAEGGESARREGSPSDGGGRSGSQKPADGGTTDGVTDVHTHAQGIEGIVDGRATLVGTVDLFERRDWAVPDAVATRASEARTAGRLPVVVGREGSAEGVVVLGDAARADWAATVEGLADRGVDVVVVTGDDEPATAFLEEHPAVAHVFANVPPAGKTATIRRLQADGRVGMVGDGTNDGPALARADFGISLGGGTALAADAADLAIADDDVGAVRTAFDLAEGARTRLRQNHALALGYNAIAIPVAVAGLFTPVTAVGAVLVSCGLIGLNCARSMGPE